MRTFFNDQIRRNRAPILMRMMRVNAKGAKNIINTLRRRLSRRAILQIRADIQHPHNPRRPRTRKHPVAVSDKCGKVQMAMAVYKFDHTRILTANFFYWKAPKAKKAQ